MSEDKKNDDKALIGHNSGDEVGDNQKAKEIAEIITQINVIYDAREDRLILRTTSNLQREFKIWITYRMFRLLNGAFDQIEDKTTPENVPARNREAMKEFKREKSLSEAQFSRGYNIEEEELESVFGDTPLLIDTVNIQLKSGGKIVVLGFVGDGKKCMVPLPRDTLIATRHLMERAAKQAEWIKDTSVHIKDDAKEEPEDTDTTKKILH